MVLSVFRLLIMFRLLSMYLANIFYLDYILHLRFPIFANASCQQLAKPLLQFFCCQTIGSIFQELQYVIPIFSEYCHNEANDNTKVNLVHWISHQELMDTAVSHSPESVEQQVGTTLRAGGFIVWRFRTRPNAGTILIKICCILTFWHNSSFKWIMNLREDPLLLFAHQAKILRWHDHS